MDTNQPKGSRPERTVSRGPIFAAIAVAIFGILAMGIVDHGPWNRPQVQTADVASSRTTGEAAREVGASVTPTESKPQLEPAAPGPKPAEPADPAKR